MLNFIKIYINFMKLILMNRTQTKRKIKKILKRKKENNLIYHLKQIKNFLFLIQIYLVEKIIRNKFLII